MRPTAEETLTGIKWSFDNVITPDLRSPWPIGLATSISNLLAQLTLRIEKEGESLWEENHELRDLLQEILKAIEASTAQAELAELAQVLREATSRQYRRPDQYPSVRLLREVHQALSEALVQTMRALEQASAGLPQATVADLQGRIRAFLKRSVERQATMTPGLVIR